MIRIRTGYSFRTASGHLDDVINKIKAIGWSHAPITDRGSTFGWVRWNKSAKKAGLKPIFGVELAVSDSINAKKPSVDYWTFIAKDSVQPINELISTATNQFRYQPLLNYEQALAVDAFKIIGHRSIINRLPVDNRDGLFWALGPAVAKGYANKLISSGIPPIMAGDNRYTNPEGKGLWEIICGRNAERQSYPQHILDESEWRRSIEFIVSDKSIIDQAIANARSVIDGSTAALVTGNLLKPEHPKPLYDMCVDGAAELKVDLTDPVYKERLDREIKLIYEKKFEDYFYIVSDICCFARKNMLVGPARGSSCGSLVCYLLGITLVDPIPHGLIFERFIDINRNDLPDIDIDFSDVRRHLVFDYVTKKYGAEHVARLGTVAMFKPKSALQEASGALNIPKWKCDNLSDTMIERSSGDARALNTLEDSLKELAAGKKLLEDHPEIINIIHMEGHPRHSSQHAAGIIISDKPVSEFVALDLRTGSTMCDKKDAEDLNLLKIDALGLKQLSVFEDTLEMASLPQNTLEHIPLDDQEAFDVLNQQKFSGIFQFNGQALQSISTQFKIDRFDDIVSITALARPGPLASGGAMEWVKRRNGMNPITYAHPVFKPHLQDTLGIVLYQEQVMEIGRKVGDLDWSQVTALRKAMSKSLGKEYFDQFGDPWKAGAIAKGVDPEKAEKVWDDLCAYGSWCLSGQTRLRNLFTNQHSKEEFFTIKQLYEAKGFSPFRTQPTTKRQRILCWDGRGLKPAETVDVVYSGRKETWLVEASNGNSIRATLDHRFLCIDGEYRSLRDIKVGDDVAVIGDRQITSRKAKTGTGSGRHNWRREELEGKAFFNGVRGTRKRVKEASPICTECGSWPTEEIHHIDGNHRDHNLHNLQAVCRKCHKKLHRDLFGQNPKPYDKGRGIEFAQVVSISNPLVEDTYDISMPCPNNNFLAEDFVVHNSFNKSHAVAYGYISYQCCWLKAHYPFEFAAATLSHEDDPMKQIMMLREMALEGFDYIPVDATISEDRWKVGSKNGQRVLVGPLSNVKGIGPKMVSAIIGARRRGEAIPDRAAKLLSNPKTDIDALFPIEAAINKIMPDPAERNIFTPPTIIKNIVPELKKKTYLIYCTPTRIQPRDENEAVLVAKRGYEVKGQTAYLNLRLTDDTDTVFGKVSRFDFDRIGREIVDRGRPGKALYAMKGTVQLFPGSTFRAFNVSSIRYIGDMDNA
jgi:hypothetical protein